MQKEILKIEGMHCKSCVKRITEAVAQRYSIQLDIDLTSKIAKAATPLTIPVTDLADYVQTLGYVATPLEVEDQHLA